jgi:hypothetical protein
MAEARVRISAEDKTQAAFSSLLKNFNLAETAASGLRRGLAGLTAGAVLGALAANARGAVNLADDLAKLSARTGFTVEALSALQQAGELADVSLEEFRTGIRRFNQQLVEAQDGTSKASALFKALGVDVKGGPEKAFREFADALATIEDPSLKATVAAEALGKAGEKLIPLLNGGSKALDNARTSAERFGTLISGKLAADSERFNDNLTKIQQNTRGIGVSIANSLIPGLVSITDNFIRATTRGEGFLQILREVGKLTVAGVGSLENLVTGGGGPLDRLALQAFQKQERIGDTSRRTTTGVIGGLQPNPELPEGRAPDPTAILAALNRVTSTRTRTPAAARFVLDPATKAELDRIAAREDDTTFDRGAFTELVAYLKDLDEKESQQIEALVEATLSRRTTRIQGQADLLQKALDLNVINPTEYAQALKRIIDPADEAGEAVRQLNASVESAFGNTAIARAKQLQAVIDEINKRASADPALRKQADQAIDGLIGVKDRAAETNTAVRDLGLTFSSAFEDAITNISDVRNIIQGLEKDLLRLGTRELLTKPLFEKFSEFLKPTGGGSSGAGFAGLFDGLKTGGANIFASIGKLFSGGFAGGGLIPPGRWGIVGEDGPEPAFGGRTGLTVRPNDSFGGTTVVNIMAQDVNSFNASRAQIAAQIGDAVNRGRRNR